eukprot:gnl/MRDRNA2_/MRDRNA2_99448_c0_seq1.p1 gnl/MRDRNA2_/MRDRNA2_99448_c0~~gnl/MRDRNA2_/MRDRNA2_99448_c0_seq1.p1  ORF type:complete len:262 (+),score=80.22 gnl/MRDRNA2_/MRDRNA2_99448_c0_seq1:59-844(+)
MGKKGSAPRQGQSSGRDSGSSIRSNGSGNFKRQATWRPVTKPSDELSAEAESLKQPVVASISAPTIGNDVKQTMQEKLEHRRRLIEGDGDRPSEIQSEDGLQAEKHAESKVEKQVTEVQRKAAVYDEVQAGTDRHAAEAEKQAPKEEAPKADAEPIVPQEEAKPVEAPIHKDHGPSREESKLAYQEQCINEETPVLQPSPFQTEPEEEARPGSDTEIPTQTRTQIFVPPQSAVGLHREAEPQQSNRTCRGLQCFRALFGGR